MKSRFIKVFKTSIRWSC